MKVKQYDRVFSAVLPVGLCIASSNLKNENAAKLYSFCGFKLFSEPGGANVTLFLWKGCQLQQSLGTYALGKHEMHKNCKSLQH